MPCSKTKTYIISAAITIHTRTYINNNFTKSKTTSVRLSGRSLISRNRFGSAFQELNLLVIPRIFGGETPSLLNKLGYYSLNADFSFFSFQ